MNEVKIFVPKGTNRQQAEAWLRRKDYIVPDVEPRCLHRPDSSG